MKDLQNPIAGVLVPAAQALVTGLLAGIIAAALGGPWLPWAAGIALLTWLVLLVKWGDLVAWLVHPAPEPPTPTIRIAVTQENGHIGALAELKGFDLDQLAQLARGLQEGQTFSEAAWTGADRPFTRAQFHELRGIFLSRGWAAWRSPGTPARGVVLTRPGQAVTRYLSGADTITTPLLNKIIRRSIVYTK